jgi:hypothetical protein
MPTLSQLGEEILDDRRYRGIKRAWPLARPESFEEWLSMLSDDQPWLSEADNLENRSTFLRMTEEIYKVISRAEYEALNESCPPWLQRLVRQWHASRAAVITLNYDTLVEAAYTDSITIHIRGSDSTNYAHYSQIYPVPITPLSARSGAVLAATKAPTFSYAKLHGSLNWAYSGRRGYYGETIYAVNLEQRWKPRQDWYDFDRYDQPQEKVPLIVPPTAGKSGFFENETVRALWNFAHYRLAAAKVVYIIGYSLPASDLIMRFLLASGTKGRNIVLIDRNPEVLAHFAALLPQSRIKKRNGITFFSEDAIERFVDYYCSADTNLDQPTAIIDT